MILNNIAADPNIDLVTIIPWLLTLLAAGASWYSARNSARKNAVEELALLVDKLEKRLSVEETARKDLEIKLLNAELYIRLLVEQLRKNNIVPVEMPKDNR